MTLTADFVERLPRIEAALHYIRPMTDKPRSYNYDPPPGVPRTNAVYDPHIVAIRDIRPAAPFLSLDVEGVRLVAHESAVRNFYDDDEVRRVHYPEVECLIAEGTGAYRVVVFDHTIRRRTPRGENGSAPPRQPVPRVHNDYTLKSGPQRVRDLVPDEAGRLLQRRFAVINVWRPIRGPLQDAPLAVCDARSVAFDDFVASDLLYRDRIGETYAVRFNPAHRWFYAPRMLENEVLMIKSYDSARDGRARFTPHAAFDDPTAPSDVLPRESIELRALAFFVA